MPEHNAHHEPAREPGEAFDPRRHHISDRDLDQLAGGLEFAERARRGLVPDLDPLERAVAPSAPADDAPAAGAATRVA